MANKELFIDIPATAQNPYGRVISQLYLPQPVPGNTLAEVLASGNTTGGIDILGSSSNIETDALKCVSIRPLAFPIQTDIVIDGNLAMEDNTNIDFGTDVDIQVNNQQVLYTDGSTNVIFSNVPRTNVAPAIGDDLTNKTYVDAQIDSAGIVDTIVAGSGISVDSTDPANPTVSNTGVLELTAGTAISITGSKSNYTINAVIPPPPETPSLAQVMDVSSVASQNLLMNTKNITGFTDLSGSNGYFDSVFSTPVLDAQISLNKLIPSSQQLIANTYYINDNATDIQSVYNAHSAKQGIVFKIGAGSYGGSTLTINNSSNQFFEATSYNGSTITELASGRGLTITNSSRIRFNGLQVEGAFTINGKHTSVAGTNCIFTNCEFLGASNIGSVVNNISGFLTFYQCSFTGALNIQPGTATIFFINCDFGNQVISNTGSPAQVIINNGANLNTLTQSAYIGVGTLASAAGVAQISTNSLTTPLNTGSISSSQIEVASDPSTTNALTRKSYVDAQVATKVGSVTAGTAISVSGTATAPIINNTGVTSLIAGSNITLSGSTGAITISSTGGGGGGVQSVSAGTGISITGTATEPIINNSGIISITAGTGLSATQETPGNPTLNNEGVLELTAGSNITITGTKSNYTISSTGGGGGNHENVALLNSISSLTESGALAIPLSDSSYNYQIEDTHFGDARVSLTSNGEISIIGGNPAGSRTFSIQLQFRLDTNAPSSSAGPITFFLVDYASEERLFCGEFDPQAFLTAKQIFFYNEIFTLTVPDVVSGDSRLYKMYIKDDVNKWQNGGSITQWTVTNVKATIWYYGQIGFQANVPTPFTPPILFPPTITSISATGANTIELFWSNVSGAENYYIYRSTDNINYTLVYVISSIYNTYIDSGLTPLTTYYYKVGGANDEGVGPLSASANATTEESGAPTFSDYWTDGRAPYTNFGGSFIHPSSDAIINSAVMTKLGEGPTAIYMIRRQDGGSWAEGTQHSPVTIKNGFTGAGTPLQGDYSTRGAMLAVGGGCTWDSDIDGRTWNIGQTKTPYNLPYNVSTNPYGYSNWP